MGKNKFHHIWPPWKNFGKIPQCPPRKNPSDARVPESYWPWILLIFARFSITFTPIRISEKVFFQCRHSLIVPDNPQVIVAAFVVDSEWPTAWRRIAKWMISGYAIVAVENWQLGLYRLSSSGNCCFYVLSRTLWNVWVVEVYENSVRHCSVLVRKEHLESVCPSRVNSIRQCWSFMAERLKRSMPRHRFHGVRAALSLALELCSLFVYYM